MDQRNKSKTLKSKNLRKKQKRRQSSLKLHSEFITIKVSGEKLETVQSFKYPGAIVTDEGSRPEILSRIAQATGALANLKVILKDKNIALNTKIRLLDSLIMPIFLYACETWTLTAETERKIQTMEMRSFRSLLGISYREHITNEEVRSRIRQAIWALKRTLDHCETTQAAVVWAHYKIFGPYQDISPGHCARWGKKGQTEKTMGR